MPLMSGTIPVTQLRVHQPAKHYLAATHAR